MGEVSVQVTEPRRRPVRRPGPSQIKMYGFCRPFRAMSAVAPNFWDVIDTTIPCCVLCFWTFLYFQYVYLDRIIILCVWWKIEELFCLGSWSKKRLNFAFFYSPTGCSSMCIFFVGRVLHIWPQPTLAQVSRRSHKNKPRPSGHVQRWSDALNFLRAGGDFGRTRLLSVSAFLRVYCPDSSKAFERRDDWANTVCDKVNRVGRWRWKRSSVALSAAARMTSTTKMAWGFIGFRGTRNFDDVCWVAALWLQSLPENCGNL